MRASHELPNDERPAPQCPRLCVLQYLRCERAVVPQIMTPLERSLPFPLAAPYGLLCGLMRRTLYSWYDFFSTCGEACFVVHYSVLNQDRIRNGAETCFLALCLLFVYVGLLGYTPVHKRTGVLTAIISRTISHDFPRFALIFGILLVGFVLVLSVIILLNLIISMFSSTYADSLTDAETQWRLARGRRALLIERRCRFLFPRGTGHPFFHSATAEADDDDDEGRGDGDAPPPNVADMVAELG
eukprot:gene37034-60209_t